MAQTLGAVKVSVNDVASAVRVTVNNTTSKKVQSVGYLPNRTDLTVADLSDVEFSDNLTARSVLTYNSSTEKFVVQDVSRLEGGTF